MAVSRIKALILRRRNILVGGKIANAHLEVGYQFPNGRLRYHAVDLDVRFTIGRDSQAQFLVASEKAIKVCGVGARQAGSGTYWRRGSILTPLQRFDFFDLLPTSYAIDLYQEDVGYC
jgi:hypothetical protein